MLISETEKTSTCIKCYMCIARRASSELVKVVHGRGKEDIESNKSSLEVDRLGVGSHGGLLEGLGESGVSVAGTGNILAGGTVFNGKGGLGDHLTSTRSDNVDTENAVGLSIGNELDNTLSVEVGLGARVGAEGERSDVVLDAGGLDLGLVLANPSDLGVGVHNAGDGSVVDVTVTSLNVLNGGDGFLLGLVGQHGTESAVTDDTDVGNLGAVLLVNDETAAVVLLDSNALEVQALGVRLAANGDKDDISIEGLLLTALGGLDVEADSSTTDITGDNLGTGLELDALLTQDLLGLLGDLGVHAGATDLAEEFNNSDLSTETGPDGSLMKR
jgi:hypothetical protein